MDILLTVAIPTYNRVDKLKNGLQNLVRQTAGKPVELLVSDNASQDGTQNFMEDFCQEHPEVTYVRNAENVGPDRNFLNCYNRASGEYVLLMGDDDLLLPGSVDTILETLAQKPVFVYLNSSLMLSEDPLEYAVPDFPEGETIVFTSKDDFMRQMGIMVTFMSSFILRNDLVQAIPDKERYIGTYFIQSHIALHTLATDGEYIFITRNCVVATANKTVPYDVYFVWGRMYARLLKETAVEAGVDPQLVHQIHGEDLRTVIFGFVKDYRISCPDCKHWDKECILEQIKAHPRLYPRYLTAVYLPRPMVKAVRAIGRAVKKCIGK